jgi:hypothetical protein
MNAPTEGAKLVAFRRELKALVKKYRFGLCRAYYDDLHCIHFTLPGAGGIAASVDTDNNDYWNFDDTGMKHIDNL